MLIFDDNNTPTILDSIHGPTLTEHMWVLDLGALDFMLAPITMLEEVICPSVKLKINQFEFVLPANWNILIYDKDTTQLDVVELSETAGREFTALVYGPKIARPSPAIISVTDYYIERKNIGPSLSKHQMLCHPISQTEWVCISSSDSYNKYIKDNIVGDIIGY